MGFFVIIFIKFNIRFFSLLKVCVLKKIKKYIILQTKIQTNDLIKNPNIPPIETKEITVFVRKIFTASNTNDNKYLKTYFHGDSSNPLL